MLGPECAPESVTLMVGLTGGIATGKSTVCGMFRELGLPIVDADALVHALLEPGGRAVAAVETAFGSAVLNDEGGVDRARLAQIVFADETARKQLEQIVHPLVVDESQRRLRELAASSAHEIVLYDAALLIETNRHPQFHRLIVVTTTPEVQLERLMERNRLSADEAGARVRAQLPLARKVALADYVIDNSGHWQETRRQVSEIHARLLEDARQLRAGLPLVVRRIC